MDRSSGAPAKCFRTGSERGNMSRYVFRFFASFFVFVVLAGCITIADQRPRLAPAPIPSFKPGTTFVFTKGRTDTVSAVGADFVVWSDRQGNRRTRSPNFVHTTAEWREVPVYQTGFKVGPDALWPLQLGKRVKFYAVGSQSERMWRCRVTGTRNVNVRAGQFDIYRVRCRSGSKPATVHERIWYYAPAIGHYVLYIYKRDRKTRRRHELVAVLPSAENLSAETRNIIAAVFQDSLENSPSGTPVAAMVEQNSTSVAVLPTMTFRNESGEFCRNYIQMFASNGASSQFPGLACREKDGVWRIPTD